MVGLIHWFQICRNNQETQSCGNSEEFTRSKPACRLMSRFCRTQTCSSIHQRFSRGAALLICAVRDNWCKLFMHGCKTCSQHFFSVLPDLSEESSGGFQIPWWGFSAPPLPNLGPSNLWNLAAGFWQKLGATVYHLVWHTHCSRNMGQFVWCLPDEKVICQHSWLFLLFHRIPPQTQLVYLFHQTRNSTHFFFQHWQGQIHHLPLCQTTLFVLRIISYSLTASHPNTRRWMRSSSEIPALNRKWMSPQSSWRAEICLSFTKASSSENPLLQKIKKINSWGWGGSSFNLCWGINWAFRWAERPWIQGDEKKKIKGGEWKCSDLPGCGKVQGGRRKVSDAFSGPLSCSLVGMNFSKIPVNSCCCSWRFCMEQSATTCALNWWSDLDKIIMNKWQNGREKNAIHC